MNLVNVRAECKLPSRLSELRSQPPRPLTTPELQRLHHLGFQTLARQLAAGTCPKCEMNKLGTGHRQLCIEPEERNRNPDRALEPPRQPWEPLPPRHLRKAA